MLGDVLTPRKKENCYVKSIVTSCQPVGQRNFNTIRSESKHNIVKISYSLTFSSAFFKACYTSFVIPIKK